MKCEAISGKHIINKFGYCDLAPYDRDGHLYGDADWDWDWYCEPCAWSLSEFQSTDLGLLTQTI